MSKAVLVGLVIAGFILNASTARADGASAGPRRGRNQEDTPREAQRAAPPKQIAVAPLVAIPMAPMVPTYRVGAGGRAEATFRRSHVRPLVALQGIYFPANGASLLTGSVTGGVLLAPRDGDWGPYVRASTGVAFVREANALRLLERDVRESASWIAVPVALGAGYRFKPGIDAGTQYEHAFALAPRGTTFGALGIFVGVVL